MRTQNDLVMFSKNERQLKYCGSKRCNKKEIIEVRRQYCFVKKIISQMSRKKFLMYSASFLTSAHPFVCRNCVQCMVRNILNKRAKLSLLQLRQDKSKVMKWEIRRKTKNIVKSLLNLFK